MLPEALIKRIRQDSSLVHKDFEMFRDLIRESRDNEWLARFHSLPEYLPQKNDRINYLGEYAALLEQAETHAEKNRTIRGKEKRGVKGEVHLIHPFRVMLAPPRGTLPGSSYFEKDKDAYLERISHLLSDERIKQNYLKVVREFPEDYAGSTSFLLEEGYVDIVVFTRFLRGTRLRGFTPPSGSLFYAGSYAGECLDAAIIEDRLGGAPKEKSHLLEDAVLQYPSAMKLWIKRAYSEIPEPSLGEPLFSEDKIITTKDLR